MAALEGDLKLIASPLNSLISQCIASGTPDHDLFEVRVGEAFARCRVGHFARSLGAMWGASEQMAEEERAGKFDFPQGQLACALLDRIHEKLRTYGGAAREVADEILQAKVHRMNSSVP